ncbi:peptidase inhibitor family I36 protein [Micromonospora sp. NBC_01655]|uniref:CHAP domain-containing protein n=1 Tax=Micromonospora sp. NBC_01655 TaxID=2975983 RepID=UPI0022587A3D|nr:CHAP domain-containing protein [Micromonospora sp. NBC_01655]MCX4471624.1 peptidase inhibitor family I36 protein [Micromonospora sp. NBC_01655]
MSRITVRVLGALGASVLAATLGVLAVAAPAQAASRDGICDAGEFCYYYNSDHAGSISDHTGSLADYGSTQPDCYEFKGAGNGQGLCIKNNAASVWNRTGNTVRVYYNSDYDGSYAHQDFAPGAKANLNATLKNNNASHQLISAGTTYPAKDDYPYKGQTTGIDPWNFYKGQCTSFAAWALRSRVGVAFHNQYAGQARWGNAKEWVAAAGNAGVPVYNSPKAGDIAVRLGGTYGHVAFVTSVNSNGSFEIDEYNYLYADAYSHRTVTVGTTNSQFSKFIRFK